MISIKLNCLTYATDSNATGDNISNAEKKERDREKKIRKKSEMFEMGLMPNGRMYLFIYGMHMHMTNASEVLGTNFNELNA